MGSLNNKSFTEGIISAVSAGISLVLLGIIFVINQNLWQGIVDFFKDLHAVQIAHSTTSLPAPVTPAAHSAVYTAVFQFALGIIILQIIILIMRLTLGSRIRRTAQTVGTLVFWGGAAYMLSYLANIKSTLAPSQQLIVWFQFWSAIIIIIGLSIVTQAVVLFAARRLGRK